MCKKKDLKHDGKECFFCKPQVMGRYFYNKKEYNKLLFPYRKTFENWYCALAKDPIELGHTLVIFKEPRAHDLINFENLKECEWIELRKAIGECKKILSTKISKRCNKARIIYFFMLSETEPHHLHFHLIPNYIDKDKLKYGYGKMYQELLEKTKKEYYEKTEKTLSDIKKIKTNFGHWFLGLLEMKKNIRKDKNNIILLHEAARQLEIFDKIDYLDC